MTKKIETNRSNPNFSMVDPIFPFLQLVVGGFANALGKVDSDSRLAASDRGVWSLREESLTFAS